MLPSSLPTTQSFTSYTLCTDVPSCTKKKYSSQFGVKEPKPSANFINDLKSLQGLKPDAWRHKPPHAAVRILLAVSCIKLYHHSALGGLEMCCHALLNCEQELQTPAGPHKSCRLSSRRALALLRRGCLLINIHEQMGGPRHRCSWPPHCSHEMW